MSMVSIMSRYRSGCIRPADRNIFMPFEKDWVKGAMLDDFLQNEFFSERFILEFGH